MDWNRRKGQGDKRPSRAAIIAGVALVLALVACAAKVVSAPERDVFGIQKLYGDAVDGMSWAAQWEGDNNLVWMEDPWVEVGSHDVKYRTTPEGILNITGNISRFYIRDPEINRQWQDVEVTVYARRVNDDGVPYSGIVSMVRSNHGVTNSLEDAPCDTRGLFARLRYDGTADFGKETSHPNVVSTDPIPVFKDGLPFGQWIGYKHVIYDLRDGTGTHQELWIDRTGGKNGGDWQLVASHDDHQYSGFGEVSCADGVDPTIPYVNGPREGSESGLPSIAVFFRADGLWSDGLQYKWASVREIDR